MKWVAFKLALASTWNTISYQYFYNNHINLIYVVTKPAITNETPDTDYSVTKLSTISINKRLECSNIEESIIYTNISVICTRDINYCSTYDIRHKNMHIYDFFLNPRNCEAVHQVAQNLHCHLASEIVKLFIRFIANLQCFLLAELGM